MTIEEFCDEHGACQDGRQWALENCASMADAWDKLKPEWLLWVATSEGVLTDNQLRLLSCACIRKTPIGNGKTVWDLLTDERSRNAVEVSERFTNGEATIGELAAARAAAQDATWTSSYAAARTAECAAARAATWTASYAAAWTAECAAARAAACAAARADACAAARADARDAARDAARDFQAKLLRETVPNPFLEG